MANTSGPEEASVDKDLLWKQYSLHVDLYKFYLDLVVKFNAFYYAVTGAILSFYFSKIGADGKATTPAIKYSLLFPTLMSFFIGIIFIYGTWVLQVARKEVFDIRDRLNLDTAPELNILGVLLIASAILMFAVGGGLLWYFYKN